MSTLATSDDLDEFFIYVAFHQGLQCLLRQKLRPEKDISLGILGQVWCLIVSIPDLCPLSYLKILLVFGNYSL